MASQRRIPILNQLKRAVQKVKFLLSFDATRWILSSLSSHKPSPGRGLSFQARPSLLDCSPSFGVRGTSLSRASSLALSPPGEAMSRSSSDASASGEDINLKADRFIEGFYRQLQMERQVSLELRYLKAKSLEKAPSLGFN